jgi:hypothetical protein
MRRSIRWVGLAIVAVLLLYVLARRSTESRRARGEMPADTMCIASRLGLPCAP